MSAENDKPLPKLQLSEAEASNLIFSSNQPRDALAGAASGGKNFLRGLTAGAAVMVGLPVMGAKAGGIRGAAAGAAMGLLGGIGLAGVGVVTGGAQFVRGVLNTPSALRHMNDDAVMWDSVRRKWINLSLAKAISELPEDDSDILKAGRLRSLEERKDEEPPQDQAESVNYYEVLNVSRTATPTEIKHGYATMALKYHPDKNPENAEDATNKFQQVSEAYRILSSPVIRAEYDRVGRVASSDGTGNETTAAGLPFVQDLVGGDTFRPFLGTLGLDVGTWLNTHYRFTQDELSSLRFRRVLRCAQFLTVFLDELSEDAELREAKLRQTVEELRSAPLGSELSLLLGKLYRTSARQRLSYLYGSTVGKARATIRQATFRAERTAGFASALSSLLQEHWKHPRTPQITDNAQRTMLYQFTENEIVNTVSAVCQWVMRDQDATPELRLQRAERLLTFGDALKPKETEHV